MTLLTICQNAADRIGISRPPTVAGNTAPEVQKLLGYCNKVGMQLMKQVVWQALREEREFTSIASETQTGILPSDFDRFIPETFWNRSAYVLLNGPVTATEWQGLKAMNYSSVRYPKFAYRGGDVLVLPVLGAGATLAFEYVSTNWVLDNSSVPKSSFTADTDTGRIDEELITRGVVFEFLDGESLPTAKAFTDYEAYLNTILDNDQPAPKIMVSADIFGNRRHFTGTPPVDQFP
jgi:hypothetical protein